MQRSIQEDIVVVQIHASRVEEVKVGKVSLGNNDCVLISKPKEEFYKNLGALFGNCQLINQDLLQLRISLVQLLKHIHNTKIGTQSLNVNSKKIVQKI